MIRKLAVVLISSALLACALAVLGGALAVVKTTGNSMEPNITAGDLVVARASNSYEVGRWSPTRARTSTGSSCTGSWRSTTGATRSVGITTTSMTPNIPRSKTSSASSWSTSRTGRSGWTD